MEPTENTMNQVEFLSLIFPSFSQDFLCTFGERDIEESVAALLLLPEQELDLQVLKLCEMFPNVDVEEIFKKYFLESEEDMEKVLELLLEERPPPTITLPKSQKELKFTIQIQAGIKNLHEIFPVFDFKSIESVLADVDGNIEDAALKLSEIAARSNDVRKRDDESLDLLSSMFPSISRRMLRAKYQSNQANLQDTINSLLGPEKQDSVWDRNRIHSGTSLEVELDQARLAVKSIKSIDTTLTDVVLSESSVLECDPAKLRSMASHMAQQRNQLYQEAASQWKKGKLTGKAAASFYAQQGTLLDHEMRNFHRQAAEAQIRLNASRHNDSSICDLHGLTLKEANECLQDKMLQWDKGWLRVITGYGHHSKGQGKLLPAMQNLATRSGWKIDSVRSGNGWFYCKR
jgi:DNA-nicking Smr family endonuclease